MPEPLNIADVLEAGYFPTSRARSRVRDGSNGGGSNSNSNSNSSSSSDDDNDDAILTTTRRRAATTYIRPDEPPTPPPHVGLQTSPTYREKLSLPDPIVTSPSAARRQQADFVSPGLERSPTVAGYPLRHGQHHTHHYDFHRQPHASNTSRRRYPPSPSVEDEAESLKREHSLVGLLLLPPSSSDDEIPSKGDPDQNPIIMEVHEHNPERRFVLVTPNDDPGSAKSVHAPYEPYEANTGRKLNAQAAGSNPSAMPAATAGAAREGAAGPSSNSHRVSGSAGLSTGPDAPKRTRVRSTSSVVGGTQVDQQRPADGAGPNRRAPPIDTTYFGCGPEVVKQTAGGREKVYHDYGRALNSAGADIQRSRSTHGGDARRWDESVLDSPLLGTKDAKRSHSTNMEGGGGGGGGGGARNPDSPAHRREGRPLERISTAYSRTGRSRGPLGGGGSPPLNRRTEDGHSSDEGRSVRPPPAMLLRKATMDIGAGEDEFVDPDSLYLMTPRARGRTPSMPASRHPGRPDDPRHSMPSLPVTEEEEQQPQQPPQPPPPPQPQQRAGGGPGGRRDDHPPPTSTSMSTPYPGDESPRGGRSPVRARSRSRAPSMRLSANSVPATSGMTSAPPQSPQTTADKRFSGHFSALDPRSPTLTADSPGSSGFWKPEAFDPDANKLSLPADRPVRGTYRRYSEDLTLTRLPDCRRRKPVQGKKDWTTLERCTQFSICPTCYDGVFKNSRFAAEFVPAARGPDLAVACDFGAVPWYRIAWLLMLKNQLDDLAAFHYVTTAMRNAVLAGESCPGDRRATRLWYGVTNPATGRPVPDFDVCYACASSVEIVLPCLKGTFAPKSPASEASRGRCALYFAEDRHRFVRYFDVLETVADRVAAANGGVMLEEDLRHLAASLERLASFVECGEDKPVKDAGWHVMRNLPALTVCGDCFDDVVRPRLDEGSPVARNFYVNAQRVAAPATCQLYSERMREVFRRACRKNDLGYLESRVRERRDVEDGIRAKLERLQRDRNGERDRGADRNVARIDERMDQLVKEWRRWE